MTPKRFAPIPTVQPGGVQPYGPAGARMPGPALLAMLRGSTFSGANPMDPKRASQRMASRQPTTLLDLLRG